MKLNLFFTLALGLALLIGISLAGLPEKHLSKFYAVMSKTYMRDLTHNILETRSSLAKSLNIIHFPYWFRESSIPVFNITLTPEDILVMNNNLPKDFFSGDVLGPENKVFVPAIFNSEKYTSDVKIRYRGWASNHWINAQRSLLIKFPEENLFNGMKSLDLIVSRDRGYLIDILNNERLRRHGLVPSNMFFARVSINGKDAGIYFVKERYSEFWLEKNGIPPDSEVFSQVRVPDPGTPAYDFGIDDYDAWTREIHTENPLFGELEKLFRLVKDSSDEKFYADIGNFLDLEKWYKAITINILAGDTHSLRENLNLLYNGETGKSEPLLEDINIYNRYIYNPEKIYSDRLDLLSRRILSNEIFYARFKEILRSMSDPAELEYDLKFYDELYAKLKPEFYKDQTKYKNDFNVTNEIEELRGWIIQNYKNAGLLQTYKFQR